LKHFRFICLLAILSSFGCAPSVLTLNIRALGATGDGKTADTAAIQQALDRCAAAGGGRVIVPAGNYLIGSVTIGSNTTLQLERDANLQGSPDLDDYPLADVRWEGRWVRGHRALIWAQNADHIAIIGPGRIAANPATGGRRTPRGPVLIEMINCQNVRLDSFSTQQRGLWSIHPTYCQNVVATNLTIRSIGGNGDGIDVDSCQRVTIENCDIDTGDDCIAIKSGRGSEGYRIARPCEDILIRDCRLGDANFACIGIGSETSGGVRNVRIERCTFTHARTFSIYIKSHIGRGAGIENIWAQDLNVLSATGGFLRINLTTSGNPDTQPVAGEEGIPFARDFHFANAHLENCGSLIEATSISAAKPLDGFSVIGITGTCRKGIALANIVNAEMSNIDVTGFTGELLTKRNVQLKKE
jgi:polygalacturonase